MSMVTIDPNSAMISSYFLWREKIQKGTYMQGSIMPCRGSVCEHCKAGKYEKTNSPILKTKIPLCDKCGELPKKFKVRKSLPGRNGETIKKDLYYSVNGERLTDPVDCVTLIKQINAELENGTFQIDKYGNPNDRKILQFCNFAEEYLEDQERRARLPVEESRSLSPNGLRLKKCHVKHLVNYFGDMQLEHITRFKIIEYFNSWEDRFRTRNLVLGELKFMLNFAFAEKGYIRTVPPFPPLEKAKLRKPDEIPSIEIQEKIISQVENDKYRTMYILMAVLTIRPCEVRAIKFDDVDLVRNKLFIRRHFSSAGKGEDVLLDGRKSIKPGQEKSVLEYSIDENLKALILPFVLASNPGELIFKGEKCNYVSNQALTYNWNKAQKKAGILKKYKLYAGTRHATLSDKRRSFDLVALKELSGHTNILTLERYAQVRDGELEDMVRADRFSSRGAELEVQPIGVQRGCK